MVEHENENTLVLVKGQYLRRTCHVVSRNLLQCREVLWRKDSDKLTGMNAKKNPQIINQDIHHYKGMVTSNIGPVIEAIMNEKPEI